MVQKIKEPVAGSVNSGRLLGAFLGLTFALGLFLLGFWYLRGSNDTNFFYAVIGLIWGVGGIGALYFTANAIIEALPSSWQRYLLPFLFVGPGIAIVSWVLIIPALRTFYQSFFNNKSTRFVGFDNYIATFTDHGMLESLRNNLIWLFFGTGSCVTLGLLIAGLANASRFETIAKALVFIPMPISSVGTSVIWKFMYATAPGDQPQVGLLNAILQSFGFTPQSWLTLQPWNNLFLNVVVIWGGTGFSVLIFSVAIKNVPTELVEASLIDGATGLKSFFVITIPYIKGTLITVATTTAIGTLNIFDVVFVMTGGEYGTSVVGTEYFRQVFTNNNTGHGAAITTFLVIAISPVLFYNLRHFSKQKGFK